MYSERNDGVKHTTSWVQVHVLTITQLHYSSNLTKVNLQLSWYTASHYLFERLHIFIRSIGNGLFWWRNRLLFGVWLYGAWSTGNDCCQRLREVWWVEIYIAGKSDILAFRLSDMSWIRMNCMTVWCLHIKGDLFASIQGRWQINSIKYPTPESFTNITIQHVTIIIY